MWLVVGRGQPGNPITVSKYLLSVPEKRSEQFYRGLEVPRVLLDKASLL
jgi:hypothetical protein